LSTHQEQSDQSRPFVVHVVGDIAPSGEAIGLQIERSGQGPINLCIRTEDVKYLVSLLLNLGCEAKRRQSSPGPDAPPTEAIPLPLSAINVGQSDDDQPFLLLEIGIRRGATRREVQGVRMRPMNTSPASVAAGGLMITSALRTSFSRTIATYSTSIVAARIEPTEIIVRLKLNRAPRKGLAILQPAKGHPPLRT
jgi:hypothetical protein